MAEDNLDFVSGGNRESADSGWQSEWRLVKTEYWLLIPILVLAFYITFIPHQKYQFPIHVDEWVHMARAEAIMRAGDTSFNDPFSLQGGQTFSSNLEGGFHVFWGVFQRISGISWVDIFRYFPSIMFVITILSVYVFSRRLGFGLEAAFFTSLIPSTIGVMGPAFLVPVAMGLVFITLSLFVAFHLKNGWSYLALFFFTCFLLVLHAPTAVEVVIILGPYLLLSLGGNFKHSIATGAALAIPFLVPFPWILGMLGPTFISLLKPIDLPTYIEFPRVIEAFGYWPVGFGLLGTMALAIKGGRENFGLTLGLLATLAMLAIYFTLHYGLDIMYTRGLIYMMLLLAIVAGAGLMLVRKIRLSAIFGGEGSFWGNNVGNLLSIVFVVITLLAVIPVRQQTPYYHMIDQEDYAAFIWIRDNVGPQYRLAVLDPWKATAFSAIAQKPVYSRIHEYPKDTDKAASKFLDEGCSDNNFLTANRISIVYTTAKNTNPDLQEVRKNVYLLKSPAR